MIVSDLSVIGQILITTVAAKLHRFDVEATFLDAGGAVNGIGVKQERIHPPPSTLVPLLP
jgi:hypothetical protein